MERSLEVEDRAPGIRVLTLNRPRKKNALDDRLLDELEAAVELGSTAHVRAFVIRGAGGAFSAGYDVTALAPPEGDRLPDDRLGAVLRRLEAHPLL